MGSWKILLFHSEALKLNQKKFCQFSSEAKEGSTATFLRQLIMILRPSLSSLWSFKVLLCRTVGRKKEEIKLV